MLKKDGLWFTYSRKSREDRDAEMYGGVKDTLAQHNYVLKDTAKRYGIKIARQYEEVVSGETVSDRPEMQRLLKDVETLRPDGVLVVEVERLSRGNPQDQGLVTDTFKFSNTLIVTPTKVYDLSKENDEEWLDFGLMRSRMEYRTIKRRMQSGRTTSSMQGKYVGSVAPYGWQRKKLEREKGYTLEPRPDTSWVLKLIYTMITTGTPETENMPVGTTVIAHTLQQLGVQPPKSDRWDPASIGRIIKNPANIGMVRIGYRKEQKVMSGGQIQITRPINQDCVMVPARWEGQISPDVFEEACAHLKANTSSKTFRSVKSSLAGVVFCGVCGRSMRRRPKGDRCPADTLMCPTHNCPTVSSYCELIEANLVAELETWLADYKLKLDQNLPDTWTAEFEIKEAMLREIDSKISTLSRQLQKVYENFEQEIYDLDAFLSRSKAIKEQIDSKNLLRESTLHDLSIVQQKIDKKVDFLPRFEGLFSLYKKEPDPLSRNKILKQLVYKVKYTKTVRGKSTGDGVDSFDLDIHVRI